jgi:hypothetical protein
MAVREDLKNMPLANRIELKRDAIALTRCGNRSYSARLNACYTAPTSSKEILGSFLWRRM